MSRISFILLCSSLFAQGDLGKRPVRGPAVVVLDSLGVYRAADLHPSIILDPPTTAGGRYVLRAVAPAQTIKLRVQSFVYAGSPLTLPSAPAANTTVICFWGPLYQEPTEFTVVGTTVTMAAGFLAGDRLIFIWFE